MPPILPTRSQDSISLHALNVHNMQGHSALWSSGFDSRELYVIQTSSVTIVPDLATLADAQKGVEWDHTSQGRRVDALRNSRFADF